MLQHGRTDSGHLSLDGVEDGIFRQAATVIRTHLDILDHVDLHPDTLVCQITGLMYAGDRGDVVGFE